MRESSCHSTTLSSVGASCRPTIVGARFNEGDSDVIWLLSRELTVEDF
jgi:hypothetical protein